MKFVKNFMMYAMAAVVAMAVTACGTPTPSGDPTPTPGGNVTFTVNATAGEGTAVINISHDGTAENTWYGFLTTDTKKADLSLVYEVAATVTADQLLTGVTAVINLSDLELDTEYKYVAFGMNADGTVYGTAGSAVFTTADGRSFTENSAWTVEHVGDMADSEGTVHYNCINIKSTDENPYYLDYFTVEDWEIVKTDMYGYVEGLIGQMKAYLGQINDAYGTSYTFDEFFLATGENTLSLGELDPGKYVAVVWGITADAKVGRLYAKSAEFDVVEEEATPEYNAWLGNWTVSGAGAAYSEEAKQYVSGTISFDITVYKNVNNKSFLVDGWNGVAGLPFFAEYDAANNAFYIEGQLLAQGIEFTDGSIGEEIILAGVGSDGKLYIDAMAYAINKEGVISVKPFQYENEDGSAFIFTQILHLVKFEGEDGYYYFSDILSGTTLDVTAATAPAEVMGLGKAIYQGKEIRSNIQKPYEFYKPGSNKFAAFSLQ